MCRGWGDGRVLVGKVVRHGKIGNAVCWNYMTEVVIYDLRWLYNPNQIKAMTEIENMIKEREILKQIHSKEQKKKEQ